ncbi:MAG: HRDC domain-containing protein, partial [Pseudomonadota bacterium]
PVYEKLKDQLDGANRAHWLAEEMEVLESAETYALDPEQAWRRLKLRNINQKALGVAIAVAAWREREAQERDIPRGRVLKDEGIYEVAQQRPTSKDDLARLRGGPKGLAGSRAGERLLEAVRQGVDVPRGDLPRIERSVRQAQPPQGVMELLRVLLKAQCDAHGVAAKLIATTADLERLALDDEADIPALHGWRRDVFGETALRLKRGEIALKVVKGAVEAFETG